MDAGSWRLAFLINVPVSIAAVMLAYRFVDRDVDEAKGLIDWSGGALATAGLGFITWALTCDAIRAVTSAFVAAGCAVERTIPLFPFEKMPQGF
jgi:hypothetical protein